MNDPRPPENAVPHDAAARCALVVFARHPFEGPTKTRLEPTPRANGVPLGRAGAQQLHRAFLRDTLRAARTAAERVLLAHTPGPAFPEATWVDEAFEQAGESFGERLDHALAEARQRAPDLPLAVIGSDTPHLGPPELARAAEACARADAVIGPATRGGFYLLGFRGQVVPVRTVFEEADECAALEQLLTRTLGPPERLAPYWDIDEPDDLFSLATALRKRAQDAWIPTETLAALVELGLAPDS